MVPDESNIFYISLFQVVILDCCHSGSGTRELATDQRVRGINISSGYIALPSTFERVDTISGANDPPTNYAQSGLSSHVLLAACSAEQPSNESSWGGNFTRALLQALDSPVTDNLTYRGLIESLQDLGE